MTLLGGSTGHLVPEKELRGWLRKEILGVCISFSTDGSGYECEMSSQMLRRRKEDLVDFLSTNTDIFLLLFTKICPHLAGRLSRHSALQSF